MASRRRSGREKMFRTANINRVPIRFAIVCGKTMRLAFWCSM
jgi:hypothetical protein